jgi:hypothetical protein
MKKRYLTTALCAAALNYSVIAYADDRLVRFDGGIGETPVSNIAATTGLPTPNIVKGTSPGGQPWVISRLVADVRADGRISVDGRGLLLAGGPNIGTNGGQSVRARLFCGVVPVAFTTTDPVPLEPDGDFRIDAMLNAVPPQPCDAPTLLILNGATPDRWFAAGIPKQ